MGLDVRGPARGSSRYITHGMCEDCAKRLLTELSIPLGEFLDSLGAPILLLGSDLQIRTGNKKARELLGKGLSSIEGSMPGEIIGCVHSRVGGGCGKTAHCASCTIRMSLSETYATGNGLLRVPAYPDVEVESEVRRLSILISTEKVGDAVLLRIDELVEAPEVRGSDL